MYQIAIVTPIFNDWSSFICLVDALDQCSQQWPVQIKVLAVDDGSTEACPLAPDTFSHLKNLTQIELLSLVCNLGHQRAIATGLCEACYQGDFDAVVVMDCDGEDQPEAIGRLIEAFKAYPNDIIVAQRGKRRETLTFQLFYWVYRLLFTALTGARIDFGNFCLIPKSFLSRLVYTPDLWNNLAATITNAKIPIHRVKTDRGYRYRGKSKMNIISLTIHGLSAISVYLETVFVRIILTFTILSVLLVIGIGVVFSLRLLTTLAIPGWASYLTGILSILFLQSLIFSGGAMFFLLNRRATASLLPALDARRYIREHTIILSHD